MHHFPKNLPNCIGWVFPLVFSFLLKLCLSFSDAVINADGVIYLQGAQMIAEGQFFQSLLLYPMPAYPFLIAVVHTIVPDWIMAAKLISVCSAAAVTVPIYWLTTILFDRKAAFFATMALAVLPSLNDIAPDVIRDPCFLLLACWSVYWMAKAAVTERISLILLSFVIGGAALLFRIEAISLFITYLMYLIWLAVFAKERRPFAIKSLLLLSIPSLVGMVYLVSVGSTAEGMDRVDQLRQMARELVNGNFFRRYQDVYAYLKESERLSPLPAGELFKLARHYMPLLYIIGMLESFFKSLFFPYAVSLWAARRYCQRVKGMPVVILVILSHSLLVLVYFLHIDYLSSRYILLSALLVLPLVGQGTVVLEEKCRQLRWRKTSLIFLVIIFLVLPLYRTATIGMGEDRVISQTGHWLSKQSEILKADWAVNDLRYYLYADKLFDSRQKKSEILMFKKLRTAHEFEAIERMARKEGQGVIILKESKKEPDLTPNFRHFRRVKQIKSNRSVVSIYADPLIVKFAPEWSEGTAD